MKNQIKKTLIAICSTFLFSSCLAEKIESGNVGVLSKYNGEIVKEPFSQGLYFHMIYNSIDEYTVKQVPFRVQDLKPNTLEGTVMSDVDVTAYVSTNPEKVPDLIIKYKNDVEDDVVCNSRISRSLREAIRSTYPTFSSSDAHTNLEKISAEIVKRMQKDLNESDPDTFIVSSITIDNSNIDPTLLASVQEKARTLQNIDRAKKEAELKDIQLRTANELAMKKAENELEVAKLNAQQKIVEAESQAKSNKLIAGSLTSELVRIQEIEAIRDAAVAVSNKAGNTVFLSPDMVVDPKYNINNK